MRIAEYKKIGSHMEQRTVTIPAVFDDYGNIVTEEHDEQITVEVADMGLVYRS